MACAWLASEPDTEFVRELWGCIRWAVAGVGCLVEHDGLHLGPSLTRAESPQRSPSDGVPCRSDNVLVLQGQD
jgi:hypothetical protein